MAELPKYEDTLPAYESTVPVNEEEAKALLTQPPQAAATPAGVPPQQDMTEAFLTKEEAFRAKPYDDGAGNITIGYGHVIKPSEKHLLNKTLSEQEARALLKQDIEDHRTPWLRGVNVPLTKGQEVALTSLAFNVGPYNPTFRRIITHLNKGEQKQAASLFESLSNVYHKDTGEKLDMGGVKTRRQTERALFLGALTPEEAIGNKAAPVPSAAPAKQTLPAYADTLPAFEDTEAVPPTKAALPAFSETEAVSPEDIGSAFLGGVREAVLPFSVTKDADKAIDTTAEVGASLAGNLAASLAAGVGAAKVGAAIGTAVAPGPGTVAGAALGGTIGTVLYGIYSGIGQEHIRSQRAGQEFSPTRAVVGSALQANPIFKASSKAEKLARIGAQALGEYGMERSYGSDQTTAVIAGSLGVLGTAFIGKKQAAVAAAGGQDVAKDMVDSLTKGDAGLKILQRTQEIAEASPKASMEELLQSDDFKRFVLSRPGSGVAKAPLGKKSLDKAFQHATSTLGQELFSDKSKMDELGDLYHNYKASMQAVADVNKDIVRTVSGKKGASKAAEMFQKDMDVNAAQKELYDTLYMSRTIDDRIGSNMEGTFAKVGALKERYTTVSHQLLTHGQAAAEAGTKAGLSNKDIGKALTGKTHLLTPEASAKLNTEAGQEALSLWRTAWDQALTVLEVEGVKVRRRANYLPMRQLRGADLATAIDRYAMDIADSIDQHGATSFKALVDQLDEEADANLISKVQELVSLGNRIGKPIDNLADLKHLKEEALRGSGALAKTLQVGAAFERSADEIADALRDFDVGNNFISYINSNLKNAVMTPVLQEMSVTRDVLRGLKLNNAADWVEHRIGVLGGNMGKGDMLALGLQQRYQYAANKLLGSDMASARRLGKAMDAGGDFVGFLTSRYYPAFLGANVRAAVRNLAQPWVQGVPELGGKYGTKTLLKAQAIAVKNMARKGKWAEQELHELGITSKYYTADNLLDQNALRKAGAVVKKIDDAMMTPFGMADKFNRYSTLQTAKIWARDLANGDKDALAALSKSGTGLKQSLMQSGRLQKAATVPQTMKELEYELAHYLNQKTQFLYGKEFHSKALAEAGRAFSMFTKWPSIMASDVAYNLAKKDWEAVRRRFAYPTAVLVLGQAVLEAEDNPWVKYAIGDITEVGPLSTFKNVDRVMGGGPIIQSGLKAVKGAAELVSQPQSIPEAIGSTAKGIAKEAVKVYTPGVSPIINEVDRWRKAFGKEKLSDILFPKDEQ